MPAWPRSTRSRHRLPDPVAGSPDALGAIAHGLRDERLEEPRRPRLPRDARARRRRSYASVASIASGRAVLGMRREAQAVPDAPEALVVMRLDRSRARRRAAVQQRPLLDRHVVLGELAWRSPCARRARPPRAGAGRGRRRARRSAAASRGRSRAPACRARAPPQQRQLGVVAFADRRRSSRDGRRGRTAPGRCRSRRRTRARRPRPASRRFRDVDGGTSSGRPPARSTART